MDYKQIIFIVLSALLPAAYSALIVAFPDFPLQLEGFTELILWVVGILVGGWNFGKVLSVEIVRNLKRKNLI